MVIQAWPAEMPAIVYCSSRQCRASRSVARRLREFNVAPVFELKGGWEAWVALQKR
jgi:rhodanese-related sulfurtransferase